MANITPLSYAECASFCSQMSMILKSGISSTEGISLMENDAKGDGEKQLLENIYNSLSMTGSLYTALNETGAFPEYMLSMIQIGEQTGRMDDVMGSLADYYEKEDSLASTVRNAVTYPLIMVVMMIIVILVLMMKVMPIFGRVFEQLGMKMTGLSLGILNIGNFLNKYWIVVAAAAVVLVGFVVMLFKTSWGKKLLADISGKFTGSRSLQEQISAFRFANGMALTLSSGLTPEQCLSLTTELLDKNASFTKKVENCRDAVSQGEDLYNTLLEKEIFSGIYIRMASIAAHTGMMDSMMAKIAARYEEEIDAKLNRILAAIEPTLVIILSIMVGIILMSVMLPLMNVMTTL